jgi:hypothetical protein
MKRRKEEKKGRLHSFGCVLKILRRQSSTCVPRDEYCFSINTTHSEVVGQVLEVFLKVLDRLIQIQSKSFILFSWDQRLTLVSSVLICKFFKGNIHI